MRCFSWAVAVVLVAVCGRANETSVWQARIDAVSSAGGGRVVVPAGVHPVAELELKSNVTLELAEGARLTAINDYSLYRWQPELKAELQRTGVVVAYGATNIALVGKGVIDGAGDREPKTTKDMMGPVPVSNERILLICDEFRHFRLRQVDRQASDVIDNASLSGIEPRGGEGKKWSHGQSAG